MLAPTGDPFTSVCLMYCGDAIASKLAPTGDPCTSVYLMHCGDAIAGEPAPTGFASPCVNPDWSPDLLLNWLFDCGHRRTNVVCDN